VPRSRAGALARSLVIFVVAFATPVAGLAGLAGTPFAQAWTTITGPDVSSYQHPYGAKINWSRVKAAGKDFAIVKATEGTYYSNPFFGADYRHSRQAGLVRGSYHFARPGYPLRTTAQAQADYYLSKLGSTLSTSSTLPPALDLEVTGGLSRGALVTWAQLFLLRLRAKTGRTPIIYTYPYFWSDALNDPAALSRYPLWMASYDGEPSTPSTLWQFTPGAKVTGIRGNVDMSRVTAATSTWSAMSDGRVADVWAASAPGRPNHVYATAAAGSATVHWLPPDTGSAPLSHYWITASPGDTPIRVSALQSSYRVTGLTNGQAYTFTVQAGNSVGKGLPSNISSAVTPMVPARLRPIVPASSAYGSDVKVRAVLSRPDSGAPISGAPVQLLVRRHGTTTWAKTLTLTTGALGGVSRTLHPTSNIDVAFRFAGTKTTLPARTYSTALVRSTVASFLSDNRVRRGQRVSVGGHVTPVASGLAVHLQSYVGGRWTLLSSRRTTSTGRFHFGLRPTRRAVRYLRVVVQPYGGRSRGVSRTLRLTVR
jgi:GH25 family lysozyme M1 (1,4-beta-N-acetylmuramidase)